MPSMTTILPDIVVDAPAPCTSWIFTGWPSSLRMSAVATAAGPRS